MRRLILMTVAAVVVVVNVNAQSVQGWKVRLDRSTSASDPDAAGTVQFTARGGGFHAVNPSAAIYWNPVHTATGDYTVGASFTLLKPSDHVNYYGLILGGSSLGDQTQSYLYFLVGQNGTWMISRRTGESRPTSLVPRTTHPAVAQPGADGTSVNALQIRVAGDAVQFLVNKTIVHTAKKSDLGTTDGIAGLRVNHRLEVQIEGFAISK